MNEIRMHVERLFQDKVLSEENIELKEEIYGNLVARYEDYLASGMSEDEALAKTKESITSIDDVLQGGEVEAAAAKGLHVADDGLVGCEEGSVSKAQAVSGSGDSVMSGNHLEAEATASMPQGATQKSGAEDVSGGDAHKKWLPYAIIVAVVVCVIAIAAVVSSCIDEAADDRDDAAGASASQPAAVEGGSQVEEGSASSTANQGANAPHADDAIVVDSSGTVRYDGEPADDLLKAVVDSDADAMAAHTPLRLSSERDVEGALRDLPLSDWLTSFDAAGKTGALTVSYEAIPERFDGDSIDAALVYNAAALMCASSEIDTINVSVADVEDVRENDRADRYVFTRQMLEQQFGMALTNDLVNDAGWKSLKEDHLYTSNFIERVIDSAERD